MTAARSLAMPAEFRAYDRIVVGLHLRWDGVFQRPQHVLTRFARQVPVVVVEEPYVDGSDYYERIEPASGVTIIRPHRSLPPADMIDDATIAAAQIATGGGQPLVWLYTPMMLRLIDAFDAPPVVFDAMDDLARFANADPRLAPREDQLLTRADVVFCGGTSLYVARRERGRNVKLYASGVDVAFFESARTIAAHPLVADLPRPVYGYIGVIDERVDLELIAAIADARPDATIAMIGPLAKIEAGVLPQRPNIRYFGQQAYANLPALLAGIDIALMPFAQNESTRSISPTKTLEYMAAGKPIVSTPVPDVVAGYRDLISIAPRDEFVRALDEAPAFAAARRDAADQRVRAASWDVIAAGMGADLEAVGIAGSAALTRAATIPTR